MQQVSWTMFKYGVSFSKNPSCFKRFYITVNSTGDYTVCDTQVGDLQRFVTRAAAQAWAGSRVGERNVRHGK